MDTAGNSDAEDGSSDGSASRMASWVGLADAFEEPVDARGGSPSPTRKKGRSRPEAHPFFRTHMPGARQQVDSQRGYRDVPVTVAPSLRADKTVATQNAGAITDSTLSTPAGSLDAGGQNAAAAATTKSDPAHHAAFSTPIHKMIVQNFKTGMNALFSGNVDRSQSPPRVLKPRGTMDLVHEYFEAVLTRKAESFTKRYFMPMQGSGNINDYVLLRTIGTGSFGRVVLARRAGNNKTYAIKILRKSQLVTTRQVVHTLEEKRILQAVNFEFLVRLHEHFKDNSNLYMVLTFVNGGDLFGLLNKVTKFTEWQAKFYISQVILGIEYLHRNSIVYRDLKPENVLVTSRGYLKMTDFGFAKRIDRGKRTWTLCGTPEYLAPELIKGAGYALSVDWWTVGVLLYELCVRRSPFFDPRTIHMYDRISSGSFRFPGGLSDSYINLVSHMLKVKVDERLGCMVGGARDIKMHEWLDGFDWVLMYEGGMVPPMQPLVSSSDDSRYFDKFQEAPIVIAAHPEFAEEFRDF